MRLATTTITLLIVAIPAGCSYDLDRQWEMPQHFDAPCPPTVDWYTQALFTFQGAGSKLENQVPGGVTGELVGSEAARVAGPGASCGGALRFPGTATLVNCESCKEPGTTAKCASSYVTLPGSLGKTLRTGSIDFWIYLDGDTPRFQGVLGRDAAHRAEEGHLSVKVMATDAIGVRLQDQELLQSEEEDVAYICSRPLPRKVWQHVGINFGEGGLELSVNGVREATTDPLAGTSEKCAPSGSSERGIAGNDEPWLLGAASDASCQDSVQPSREPLEGRLANLRISEIRRDFSRLDFSL